MNSKKTFKDWINGDLPVLVDFHATWCGPCKMLAPVVQGLQKDLVDQLKVLKVDIDKNQNFAQSLQVKGVPTLMLFKNGKVLWRQSGFQTAESIKQSIKAYIN